MRLFILIKIRVKEIYTTIPVIIHKCVSRVTLYKRYIFLCVIHFTLGFTCQGIGIPFAIGTFCLFKCSQSYCASFIARVPYVDPDDGF